jgi:copper resistance protein D
MPELYYANVTVHMLAAMLWLGGMFFLGIVGAPVLRTIEPVGLRQRLFQQLGTRFRVAGWWAIGTLVVTGTINLYYRGWLHWDGVLGAAEFWRTGVGHALAWKLIAVAAMISVSLVHDFVVGPHAGRAAGEVGAARGSVPSRRVSSVPESRQPDLAVVSFVTLPMVQSIACC